MFDLKMRPMDGAGVPTPLPGRGMVFLDASGFLAVKMPSGEVRWPYGGDSSAVCGRIVPYLRDGADDSPLLSVTEPGIVARGGAMLAKVLGSVEVEGDGATLCMSVEVGDADAVVLHAVLPAGVSWWGASCEVYGWPFGLAVQGALQHGAASGGLGTPVAGATVEPIAADTGVGITVSVWLSEGAGTIRVSGGHAQRVA